MGRISLCRIIQIQKIHDDRGNLSFVEGGRDTPFDIKRIYYLYDVPGKVSRGAHAHRELHQLMIAMSGSFDVVLDDGQSKKRFHLDRPYCGLYICPMIWRDLENFSPGAVCLVMASDYYDEGDYIRNHHEFMALIDGKK